jgi:hypothetical protein
MTAANYNLVIDQGSDFAIQLTLSENGSAKDLTNYSARAQLRSKKLDTIAAATFTCTVPNPSAGILTMELNNSVTANLSAGLYYYDLELYTANDGNVTRLLEGQATVTQEVTR